MKHWTLVVCFDAFFVLFFRCLYAKLHYISLNPCTLYSIKMCKQRSLLSISCQIETVFGCPSECKSQETNNNKTKLLEKETRLMKMRMRFVLVIKKKRKKPKNQHTMCLKCGRTLKMLSILVSFFVTRQMLNINWTLCIVRVHSSWLRCAGRLAGERDSSE